jgi:hypothetical protein
MILDPCFRSLWSTGTVLQPYMNSKEEVTRSADGQKLRRCHRTPTFLVPDPQTSRTGGAEDSSKPYPSSSLPETPLVTESARCTGQAHFDVEGNGSHYSYAGPETFPDKDIIFGGCQLCIEMPANGANQDKTVVYLPALYITDKRLHMQRERPCKCTEQEEITHFCPIVGFRG